MTKAGEDQPRLSLAVVTQGTFYCDRTASLGSAAEEEAPIKRDVKSDFTLVNTVPTPRNARICWQWNSKSIACQNLPIWRITACRLCLLELTSKLDCLSN